MHPDDNHDQGHAPAFDLGDEDRLPWLESADDIEAHSRSGARNRLIGFVIAAVVALALLLYGLWWLGHRKPVSKLADGSTIEASKDPYKIAPADPGGKQVAGTGDTSYKVSQGEHADANLADSSAAPPAPSPTASRAAPVSAASPTTSPTTSPSAAPTAPAAGGVAVQIGAYSSTAKAEAAWSHLQAEHEALKGMGHRVVEGKADIGTVYRLQAIAPDGAAANGLCSKLQADGVKCQVKH